MDLDLTAHPPPTVTIPAGRFTMGAVRDDKFALASEYPTRQLAFPQAFAITAAPITLAQWAPYAREHPEAPAPHHAGGDPALPATGLNWHDARAYAAWLSRRTGRRFNLPTEAQWEYACRAGTASVFPTGDVLSLAQANYLYGENRKPLGVGRLTPVGAYPPNPWGLYDCLGNVLEWVLEPWQPDLSHLPADGPAPSFDLAPEPDKPLGVVRGGAWDHLPRLLRASHRDPLARHRRLDITGFRLAEVLPV